MSKVKFPGLSMESVGALVADSGVVDPTLNLDAAYLDFDPTGIGYARVGAKRNGAGTSAGFKVRTLNAGAFVDAVTYAADGTPTFAKGPQVTAGVTALQAMTATAVTVGGVAVTSATAATTVSIDPTAGGATDAASLLFKRNGSAKWVIGNNVNVGSDTFSVAVVGVGSAIDVSLSTRAVTIAAGMTIAAGGITSSAGTNSFGGPVVASSTLSAADIVTVTRKTIGQQFALTNLSAATNLFGSDQSTDCGTYLVNMQNISTIRCSFLIHMVFDGGGIIAWTTGGANCTTGGSSGTVSGLPGDARTYTFTRNGATGSLQVAASAVATGTTTFTMQRFGAF